jgi:hypothetical protein
MTQTTVLHIYHDETSAHLLATSAENEKGLLIDIQGPIPTATIYRRGKVVLQ